MTNVVQKQLVCLEDLDLGTGVVLQDRGGIMYQLTRIDLYPTVNAIEDLDELENFDKAKVGLVTYKKLPDGWVVDPIPLEAFEGLGAAASRGVTGPGELINKGFGGVGGPALATAVGLSLGLQASLVSAVASGGPVDEVCAVLTLPGTTSNAAQLAISVATGLMYVKATGGAWKPVALQNTAVEFTALKAASVLANSVGTPKD